MAGEGDAERLVVLLEARIRDFEKNMAKASGTATRSYGQMRAGSKSATAAMESDIARASNRINAALASTSTRIGALGRASFQGLISSAVPAIAATIGVTAAIAGAKAALDEFGDISDQSQAAGTTAEFFQEIAYQAKLGGVSMDQTSTALSTFNKNSGLAAAGTGRMVTQLKLLDPELLRAIQSTTSQEERVKLVADAIDRQTDSSKKAAIATAAFGDAGQKLVAVFQGGRDAIRRTADEAQRLGLIVSNDLIARADEMGDKFDTATQILDLQFKRALVELAPLLTGTAEAISGIVRAIGDMSRAIANAPGMQDLFAQTAPLTDRAASVIQAQIDTKLAAIKTAEAQLAKAGDSALGTVGKDAGGWFGTKIGAASGIDNLKAEVAQLQAALTARHDPKKFDVNATFDALAASPKPDIFGRSTPGAGPVNRAADPQAQKRIDAVTASLQRQLDALSQTDREQAIANQLAAAHVEISSKDGQKIAAMTGALYDQKAALEDLRQTFTEAQHLAEDFASSLIGDLFNGKDAAESLADAFKNLGQQLIQMAANQAIQSLFSNLMSSATGVPSAGGGGFNIMSLFGGGSSGAGPRSLGFADGTANTGGRRGQPIGIVHGQEAVIPLPGGGRVPVQIVGGASSASARQKVDVSVSVGVTVDRNGNLQAYVKSVSQQEASEHSKVLVKALPGILADQRRRGAI